jgi:hypothetical protein
MAVPTTFSWYMQIDYLKKRLLYSVAGLDRGFAANSGAQLVVETAIYSLVGAAGGSPNLTWTVGAIRSFSCLDMIFIICCG